MMSIRSPGVEGAWYKSKNNSETDSCFEESVKRSRRASSTELEKLLHERSNKDRKAAKSTLRLTTRRSPPDGSDSQQEKRELSMEWREMMENIARATAEGLEQYKKEVHKSKKHKLLKQSREFLGMGKSRDETLLFILGVEDD